MALQRSLNSTPVRQPAPFPTPVQPDTNATKAPALLINERWEQLILRFGFILTGAFVLNTALQAWSEGQIGIHHALVWVIFAEYALAFCLMTMGILSVSWLRRLAWLLPACILFVLIVAFYIKIQINLTVYGTDNIAFSHVAAERLLQGENPYTIKDATLIQQTAERFGVPTTFITSTTDGKPLDNLMSWPAGSALVFVPALWLGVTDLRWVVVAFQIAVLALLWLRAPAALRPLAVIVLAVDPYLLLYFTGGGVLDYIWVLPVLASAITLYQGRFNWSAACYGLAAGIKQQPWLLAPFLAIWVWQMHRERSVTARARAVGEFGAIALAGFLALNLPFIVWDFPAWLRGVLLPFNEQLVPFGSGISLLTQTGIADLPKGFYSAATFGVWGVLLLAYALHFRTLKHALWLAPAVIMWFSYRSLQNYFIYWTPMLIVALMSWWEEEQRAPATIES